MANETQLTQERALNLGKSQEFGYGVMPSGNDYRGATANIQLGGQLGFGARIMNLDAGTPQIFNPAIIVVTQTPVMFDKFSKFGETLKASWEVDARSINGIDFGYNMNTADSPVGHDGQQLSMPTNSQRSPVSPSVTWTEKYGNIIFGLHYFWILAMQHPDTQASYLSAIAELENNGTMDSVPPWLISTFSMSFMAIQPDPTGLYNRAVEAAFYTACFPIETGMIGLKREINTTDQMERTINYKAMVQHNDNTREVGALIMKALNFHRPDYQRASTITGVDSRLGSAGLDQAAKDAIAAYKDLVKDNVSIQNVFIPGVQDAPDPGDPKVKPYSPGAPYSVV